LSQFPVLSEAYAYRLALVGITMKRLALIVALCLLTNVSFAEFENGNALLSKFQKCEKYENGDTTLSNNWSCGFAMGLVVGVHDAWPCPE
jgi:hypothetical protein